MQTDFTPEQLADPMLARANGILRACVHCGFCTATCPSYQVLGDELDSPRGRIYLIKEMLESGRPADARTARHIDRCLSCLACTTTCPSGVDYMHLIDMARVHVERTWRRPWHDRLLRGLLARLVPYPGRFRLALGLAKLARPFRRLVPNARLRAMLDMAAAPLPPVSRNDDPQTFPALGERRARVALMTGCAQKALNTDINDATIRLLRRAGCEVVIPPGMGCCGALSHHLGRAEETHDFAAKMIAAVQGQGAFDALIINTSGCGTVIKDYAVFMADTPGAGVVSGMARDVTEFVAQLGLPPVKRSFDLTVAYHAACSLQHGQKITAAPKDLLRAAGFRVVEPADAHLCCGSAGTYNLLQPTISDELRRRKVATLEARQPDLIAAGNIGCMMQIGAGTGLPVVHTAELLDWATGGPLPPSLAGLEKARAAPI
ncbi:glycolate oxidase subunit GlcF [Paracoccus sp. p3-h83]|uniref:glycolate oxidase subunit GlcF n=1 Tax=Paracoccus sp. p3-h83 TaxID=3342805 RepID=UPI0035B96172